MEHDYSYIHRYLFDDPLKGNYQKFVLKEIREDRKWELIIYMLLGILDNTISMPKVECRKVQCDCGEEYTLHRIGYYPACGKDKEFLVYTGLTVKVIDNKEVVLHSILQCPICNGLDLRYWGEKEIILNRFQQGDITYTLRLMR